MTYAIRKNGVWQEVSGAFVDARGTTHSASWSLFWTPQEIADAGLVEIVETERPAFTHDRVLGVVDGKPTYTYAPMSDSEAIDWFEAERASRRAAVNAIRDRTEEGVVQTAFGPMDADTKSSKRLLALQAAAIVTMLTGTAWEPLEWTMGDNSKLPVTEPLRALQMAGSVTQFAAIVHEYAGELKRRISEVEFDPADRLTGLAALDAIDIENGWPTGLPQPE